MAVRQGCYFFVAVVRQGGQSCVQCQRQDNRKGDSQGESTYRGTVVQTKRLRHLTTSHAALYGKLLRASVRLSGSIVK